MGSRRGRREAIPQNGELEPDRVEWLGADDDVAVPRLDHPP